MPETVNDQGNPVVTGDGTEKPSAPVKEPTDDQTKKIELTAEQLDEIKAEAVASAKAEQEERIRREEAERQGNFELIAKQAQDELKEVNLALWRTKALNKFKLPDSLIQALVGETEKEIMSSAKKLKEDFDAEVQARVLSEGEKLTPPDPQGKNNPINNRQDTDALVRTNMSAALGIGKVHVRH